MNEHPPAAAPDFVDRLVMKALGAADLPVPRLTSLYEPAPTMAGFRPSDADEEPAAPEDAADPPRRAARAPLSGVPVRAVAAATAHDGALASPRAPGLVEGPRVSPAAGGNSRSRRAVARALAEGRPAADRPDTERGRAPVAAATAPTTRLPDQLRADDGDRSDGGDGPSLRPRREALVAVPRGRAAAPASGRHRGADDVADGGPDRREGVLVPRASGLALPHAATQPRGLWRPRPAEAGERPDTDVAVNVTIGRIEVRATPAGSSEPRRTPSRGPQPLALDEYLGQRGAR